MPKRRLRGALLVGERKSEPLRLILKLICGVRGTHYLTLAHTSLH